MRLFFALWPDTETRAALHAWAREAQTECGGRVMRADTLHLTLAFLGDVEPAQVKDVQDVHQRAPLTPFTLVLDQLGYWPARKILWAGAQMPPAPLEATHAALREHLRARGWHIGDGVLHPHITLLRHVRRAPAELMPRPLSWHCSDYVLVHSVLTPHGPHYRLLRNPPACA